jgi:hypothetical protein
MACLNGTGDSERLLSDRVALLEQYAYRKLLEQQARFHARADL